MENFENLKIMNMTGDCEGINPTLYPPLNFRGGRSRRRMNMSLTSSGRVKAFTLAETLITLTILGVVAAITIPALINKYNESANRTKLKKAMAAYEKALNQMIIDNDIKGSITAVEGFGLTDNCSGSRPYFKAIKEIAGNNCRFQTADKVWWDITDIEHPLISLKDEITDDNIATLKGNADSLDDDKTSFVMVGEIKDGIVRINDKGGIVKDSDDEKYLDKLYTFINNEKKGSGGGVTATCNDDDYGCKYRRGDTFNNCSNEIGNNCLVGNSLIVCDNCMLSMEDGYTKVEVLSGTETVYLKSGLRLESSTDVNVNNDGSVSGIANKVFDSNNNLICEDCNVTTNGNKVFCGDEEDNCIIHNTNYQCTYDYYSDCNQNHE